MNQPALSTIDFPEDMFEETQHPLDMAGVQAPQPLPTSPISPLNTKGKQRTTIINTEMDEMRMMMARMMSKVDQLSERVEKDTVLPGDSASEAGPKRKLWSKTMEMESVAEVEESTEEADIRTLLGYGNQDLEKNETTVVRGYFKTNPMVFNEQRRTAEMKPVQGLQQVFRDERLNFLLHIHTALYRQSSRSEYPPDRILERIAKIQGKEPQSPQDELLRNVIMHTFDQDRMQVVANGYRLPIVRVGMRLTERYLFMMLDSLHCEYKSKWLDNLGHLEVPKFSEEHRGRSTSYLHSLEEREAPQATKRSGSLVSRRSRR